MELNPSKLGTINHWDEVYDSEIRTYTENGLGHEGESWFGKSTSRRMVGSLLELGVGSEDPIVDLGCGNGMLLVDLWKIGYKNLLGVDYSKNAISLACAVAQSRGCPASFRVQDISCWEGSENSFKVALDKGTYDAISLDPDNSLRKREAYIKTVHDILISGGYLIITSCNWTESEIITQMSQKLKYVKTLPTDSFTFGGVKGSTTTTTVFEKISP